MRSVFEADAILWLKENKIDQHSALIASLPDISEFQNFSLLEWKNWFTNTAKLILDKTPEESITFFYQTDIKIDGVWVDKSYLCMKAAEVAGSELIFHKMICRVPPGKITYGRPAYSHILAFSKKFRPDLAQSTADIIPDLGPKTWERGMGLEACLMIAKFLKRETKIDTLIHPFCGEGSMLSVANEFGLKAIGIERSKKRADMARELKVNPEWKKFIK